MYNDESNNRRFYAVTHGHDTATIEKGRFIPSSTRRSETDFEIITPAALPASRRVGLRAMAVVGLVALTGITSAVTIPGSQLTARVWQTATVAPTVIIEHPYTNAATPLNYGVNVAFSEPAFYTEARDAFILGEQTFIDINLVSQELRFFREGVLAAQYPILAKGLPGSWWETPAGLYQVNFKRPTFNLSAAAIQTSWNIGFQGNFFIHGWPRYQNGVAVPEDFAGGSIRLSDDDAKALYEQVTLTVPVIVHEVKSMRDNFLYEPKIPELQTPHYLIADIKSNTVLASSDMSAIAPIASLTKLMTALVAAENINLDTTVPVVEPTFVESMIPRLEGRTRVSMYSLLQLLLIESSNEAAEVIAAVMGREKFIAAMNEKAAAIGMQGTRFVDPSGLGSENVSSVRDLLLLTQYIYDNRRFIIELTRDQNLPTVYTSGEFGTLQNFNTIKETDNFIGGKIGETTAAGQTSVSLHTLTVKGEERILAIIILGSEGRDADVRQLLYYAEERFGW